MCRRRTIRAATFMTMSWLLAACQQSAQSPFSASSESVSIDQFATSASADGTEGLRRSGTAPSPAGGPTITVSGNPSVVNGGTLAVGVQGATPFASVYVLIGGKTLGLAAEAAGGISGHYEIRLPAPQTSATILLTFPQAIALTDFQLLFAAANAAGVVGPYAALPTRVTQVGTGDIQVTLSWDADSDVDLHVIGPDGEEIYYGSRTSSSGGELDLDSNAACAIDGVRNENITWPVGRAPAGTYTVRVDYWDNCGVDRTNYTVRINNGGSGQIVSGFFAGLGDQGSLGSGRLVATFERQTGPASTVTPISTGSPRPAAQKVRRTVTTKHD